MKRENLPSTRWNSIWGGATGHRRTGGIRHGQSVGQPQSKPGQLGQAQRQRPTQRRGGLGCQSGTNGTGPPQSAIGPRDHGGRHHKTSHCVLRSGITVKYALITSNKVHWPITLACEVLGVSAGGYFEHGRRTKLPQPSKPGSHKRMSDEALLAHIPAIHA